MVVNCTGDACATIGAFRFVHARETRDGTPNRGVVLRDPIGVVERCDDGTDDDESDKSIDEDRAALTRVSQVKISMRLPDTAVTLHEVASGVNRHARSRARSPGGDSVLQPKWAVHLVRAVGEQRLLH